MDELSIDEQIAHEEKLMKLAQMRADRVRIESGAAQVGGDIEHHTFACGACGHSFIYGVPKGIAIPKVVKACPSCGGSGALKVATHAEMYKTLGYEEVAAA